MYEAAAYPELWPEALQSFANALGGFGGTIVGFSADEKLISYVSPDTAEIAVAYARGGWADHNFRIQLGAPLIRAGREFVHERMLLDRRGLERQRIQTEFLNAFRLRSFIGFEFVPGEIGGCVERGTAEVEDWEISELERISHHIKRIGAIASARGAMFAQGVETGLDQMRAGAILLDRRGRIVSMNAWAASNSRPGVSHPVGATHAARHRDGERLRTHAAGSERRRSRPRDRPGRGDSPSLLGRIFVPCPRRPARRAGDRYLHARAHPASAHSASGSRIRKRRTPSQCVSVDARRGSSGRVSRGWRRPCFSIGAIGRVAGNATRRPQVDFSKDRCETSGRACRAFDPDRPLAIV